MQDIGATSAGGGGRGFGSAGIGNDSGGRGKLETANTVFRFSFKDFDQLGALRLVFHNNVFPLL